VTAFIQRMGDALGLDTTPAFYFRYSRYGVEEDTVEDGVHDWVTYNTTDQLTLMAKLVFSYQHRETEPSFTIMLRENHLINVICILCSVSPTTYQFNLSMHSATIEYQRNHVHSPHAIQFVLTEGAQNPFPACQFKWVPHMVDRDV
jgi:hypothetical protein